MLYYENCGKNLLFSHEKLKQIVFEVLEKHFSTSKKILILPPDITRIHSKAGILTAAAVEYFSGSEIDILPALGTHVPMTLQEIHLMFPGVNASYFHDHNWRKDLIKLGTVPGEYVEEVSQGKLHFDWPAQVNSLLVEGQHDVIFSIGQVVPHEVIGFANHNKNIFIGTGGAEAIHKSHFLGAAYGMERIMGRIESPVRSVLNYATDHFAKDLPVVYILTVVEPDELGVPQVRGLFIGDGYECYIKAAEFSKQINCIHLPEPLKRAVVYLDPQEYRSTWLGNKAIYRTRLALADDAELTIIAPGLK
ncbi:MAG: lactate racemase domain-containing protein, partial [Spirochaetaceae bacterium]|nr:lactate racemase domain-containing protein [Spirochaetaceae bacterium]